MNHFEQILCLDEPHHIPYTEEAMDKDTNQQQLSATVQDVPCSPFDNSPKPSTFFFSTHSPRQQSDLFQFHPSRKYQKDSMPTMARRLERLEFQDENSQLCEEEQISYQELSSPQSVNEPSLQSSSLPSKGKKIKKNKNSKGLKSLSIGVYEIVTAREKTSYKEVANTLIQQLNSSEKESKVKVKQDESSRKKVQKDEHNVKRRVYDALNVLISAQLLRKEGKNVICNMELTQNQDKIKEFRLQQHCSIKNQLQRLRNVVQQKRQQQLRLKNKRQKIEKIIRRNFQYGPNYEQQIRFPFIGVKSSFDDIKAISIGKRDLQISYLSNNVLLMGDIDTIEELPSNQIKVSNA